MPAAILAAGLVAIALAFAAISAVLLIRTLIVQPVRNASSAAAEVAVIGGAVSWLLSHLADLIEASLAGMAYLAQVGQQQASDWWNYLVNYTVAAQFWNELNWAHWLQSISPGLVNVLDLFPSLWSYVVHSLAPSLSVLTAAFWTHIAWVVNVQIPWISGIGDDLAGLHRWIDGYELPLIRGIGNDLAGLRDWIGANAATRSEVARAEAEAIARAEAIAVPIVAAITAIERSPCMKFCNPLGEIGGLLQGLEDAGMLLILLGLIEETRRDPHAVQAALRSIVVPIVHDAAGSIGLG